MSEPPSGAFPGARLSASPLSAAASPRHRSFFDRLSALFLREPDNREDLLELLSDAHAREVLDADALAMMEGVLQVASQRAGDLMVPSAQMDVIDINEAPATWMPRVIATAHSRFPVIDGSLDQVIGVLLAKDLLRLAERREPNIRAMLRPAMFVPDSMPLNVLLREFRARRNHMAIVCDEFGSVAGLITIEDVLEQIVGDIDDEYDDDEAAQNIVADGEGRWRVKAHTPLEQFNEAFGTTLDSDASDTIGGLLGEHLGRVPRRGDSLQLHDLRLDVLRADARHALLLQVERLARTVIEEFGLAGQPGGAAANADSNRTTQAA